MPERIQLRRTKGFRLREISPNAIVVSRPTIFGNPWTVCLENGYWQVYYLGDKRCWTPLLLHSRAEAQAIAVQYFRVWLKYNIVVGHTRPQLQRMSPQRTAIRGMLPVLAGRDLACWCPLDQPCHADVLIELANQEARA
jgi:hypothetical protein